jgi:3D (Asp-Asp-Asp) domain-containing protein
MIIKGRTYVVEDRGGYIAGNRLDVFEDNCETAVNNGRQMIPVEVIRK